MILFDSSVLIDARDPKSAFHSWAADQISEAASTEGAAVNTVCIAETAVRAEKPDKVAALLADMGLNLLDLPALAAIPAAKAYAQYLDRRKAEGRPGPKSPLPDFLIGAHAQVENMALVTRDPDRVKKYFPSVTLITP
jgi:predicted nucleic acid-binding protein